MQGVRKGEKESERRTGEGREELGGGRVARAALVLGEDVDPQAVRALEDLLRDAPRDELDRARELAQLVDREDAVAHELGLGARELREDETRAVAQEDILAEADRLEVLGLARRRRDRHLLLADEGVDRRRLADVRVPDEADDELLVAVTGGERHCEQGERQDLIATILKGQQSEKREKDGTHPRAHGS